MRVVSFPVTSTNIFPIANSTSGGQLVTEHNLKCKDFVSSKSSIKYECGPSYVHSSDDFSISKGVEGITSDVGTSKFTISEGSAIIDGYYIELLTPIEIDIAALNVEAQSKLIESPLGGNLGVGLKIMYSGETTMSGTIKAESSDNAYYEGIVVVILPEDELICPEDTAGATSRSNITCNLKLGTVVYDSATKTVQGVANNSDKMAYIYPERLHDITSLINETAVTRTGVSTDKFYTFSGRTTESESGWCDSTGSLMIWDKDYASNAVTDGSYTPSTESAFYQSDDTIVLNLAHKQPDSGNTVYKDKVLSLPKAGYALGTPGVISPEYTSAIKSISSKVEMMYNFGKQPTGKFLGVVDTLEDTSDLPTIRDTWSAGSYIAVRQDKTVSGLDSDETPPSTLQMISGKTPNDFVFTVQGTEATYSSSKTISVEALATKAGITGSEARRYVIHTNSKDDIHLSSQETNTPSTSLTQNTDYTTFASNLYIPRSILSLGTDATTGKEVAITTWSSSQDQTLIQQDSIYLDSIDTENQKLTDLFINSLNSQDSRWIDADKQEYGLILYYQWKTTKTDIMEIFSQLTLNDEPAEGEIYGYVDDIDSPSTYEFDDIVGTLNDYVTIIHVYDVEDEEAGTVTTMYTPYLYLIDVLSDPAWVQLMLTGSIALATEDSLGGVKNVPQTATGAGYVYVNDNGYMQLLDFDLLAQGVLAYQLGEDLTLSTGVTTEQVQADLDDVVNNRVAFPKSTAVSLTEPEIVVNVSLEKDGTSTDPVFIYIHGIDSRFNTYVHFKFSGEADNNTFIYIYDCEKIKITKSFTNTVDSLDSSAEPVFIIKRCGLYYDPTLIDNINSNRNSSINSAAPFEDITFWTDETNLLIENNTIQQTGGSLVSTDITAVTSSEPNDNHFQLGLRSITLDRYANVVNMEVFVSNQSTLNVSLKDNTVIAKECELPQGTTLQYPVTAMTKQLRVSGSFVSAYMTDQVSSKYVVLDTQFTLLSETYDSSSPSTTINCQTLFHSRNTEEVISTSDEDMIQSMIGSNQFHIFRGGSLN